MKADHTQVTRLLKTARGQIDGILKMVEEDRYCLDVSSQIMAAQSILKKANRMVLKSHMDCCVREAVASGAPDEKLEELAALLQRLLSQGAAVILVSHDLEFCARHAHRCALFFDGAVVAQDQPRAFFSGNRFYTTATNRIAAAVQKKTGMETRVCIPGHMQRGGSPSAYPVRQLRRQAGGSGALRRHRRHGQQPRRRQPPRGHRR